jgi:putative nucleotidyltransferase with HDIG domain
MGSGFEQPEEAARVPASSGDAKPRILVVDDDAMFSGIVADVLAARGYEAEAINDPREALSRAGSTPYAAAIVDLRMPEMGGLELTEGLRSLRPDMQVVILTGHGDLRSATEGIRQGVFAFLQKDEARIGPLERTLEAAVSRWRGLQRAQQRMDDLEDANQRLRLLHESSLAGEMHTDVLMRRAADLARDACFATSGRLLVFDAGSSGLMVRAAAGDRAEGLVGMRLAPEEGIAACASRSPGAIHVADPVYDARFSRRTDGLTEAPLGLLAAPVRHGTIVGALLVAGSRRGTFSVRDEQILTLLGRQVAIALENATQKERALNFFTHTSDILVSFLEAIDIHHPGHSRGVAMLSDLISRRLGLPDAERRSIHFAALLHDIGKVRIDRKLLGAGSLPAEALPIMREHPRLGVEILRPISMWEELLDVILSHHERWDGRGYPAGLSGEEIPLGARIVAVADAFDAMSRPTPYRTPKDEAAAIAELEAEAGRQFDPKIVRLFLAAYRENGDPRRES